MTAQVLTTIHAKEPEDVPAKIKASTIRKPISMKLCDTQGLTIEHFTQSKGTQGQELYSGQVCDKSTGEVLAEVEVLDNKEGLAIKHLSTEAKERLPQTHDVVNYLYDMLKLSKVKADLDKLQPKEPIHELFQVEFKSTIARYNKTYYATHPEITQENLQGVLQSASPGEYAAAYEIRYYEYLQGADINCFIMEYEEPIGQKHLQSKPLKLEKAKVILDLLHSAYFDVYINREEEVNGYVQPYFEYDTLLKAIAHMVKHTQHLPEAQQVSKAKRTKNKDILLVDAEGKEKTRIKAIEYEGKTYYHVYQFLDWYLIEDYYGELLHNMRLTDTQVVDGLQSFKLNYKGNNVGSAYEQANNGGLVVEMNDKELEQEILKETNGDMTTFLSEVMMRR